MTIQAVTTFIKLETPSGDLQAKYQNGIVGQAITYSNASYTYLPFIYSGTTKNRAGDNIQSTLTLAANQLSINLASEAVRSFWFMEVDSVLMHPQTFVPNRLLSREYWTATTLSYDTSAVQIQLGSAIDAVGADALNKTLLESYVGALPLTASIRNA